MDIPLPFRLHEVTVPAEWTDYNHHLTESAYLLIMGESSDAFFRFFGVDDSYRQAGHSLYTVETHLRNLREAREGERLSLTIQASPRLQEVRGIIGIDEAASTVAGRAAGHPVTGQARVEQFGNWQAGGLHGAGGRRERGRDKALTEIGLPGPHECRPSDKEF